uniref:NAC domain-containing protein n=2 Tax=Aegilops tauschii subsp. strangulata TaxID=200361 RepID=A0A453CDH0_AEGTS
TNAQCSSTMTALTRSAEFLLHRPMENSTLASSTMQTQLGGNSDNDSPDWIERTFKDSTNKIFRKDEDSCPGQNIVCSDSNIVTHCSATMTTWNSTMVSSSTQLGGSSDDLTSSAVEQPSSNNDDIVDSDSMNSSITTEHSDVSDEQATETSTEVDETSSTPWWLVPGFRFRPTDKEIVLHYLKPKVLNSFLKCGRVSP